LILKVIFDNIIDKIISLIWINHNGFVNVLSWEMT